MSAKDKKRAGKTTKLAAGPASPTFIEDPYGFKNLEIAEAQQSTEELQIDTDLAEALAEWKPDENAAVSSEGPAEEALSAHDIRELRDSLERDAAELETEIEQDGTLQTSEEASAQLDHLSQAMAAEQVKADQDEAVREAADKSDAELELRAQIAEDQALAAELKKEQAEAEGADEISPELQAALPKPLIADENGQLDLGEIQSCIEALLFMTDKPMSVAKLREHLGSQFEEQIFLQAMEGLKQRYLSHQHGIEIAEVAGGYQFRTKPIRAPLAKRLAKVQTQRLSTGAMETLAIIAYRQPVMKEDIDKIRGVDSSYFVRGLMDRKLIKIDGRSELPGRPMLYSVTQEFLELFGLRDLGSLPSLRELEQMVPASDANAEDEDPRVKEMRRLVSQMKTDESVSLKYNPHEDETILQEIRQRVSAISTTTPYLEEQKRLEKEAQEASKRAAAEAQAAKSQPDLGENTNPEAPPAPTEILTDSDIKTV